MNQNETGTALADPLSHRKLNMQQSAFVEAYVRNGADAVAAAKEAGYPSRFAGRDCLASRHVRAAIQKRLDVLLRTEGMTLALGTAIAAIRSQETSWKIKLEAAHRIATWAGAGTQPAKTDDAKSLEDMTIEDLESIVTNLKDKRAAAAKPVEALPPLPGDQGAIVPAGTTDTPQT